MKKTLALILCTLMLLCSFAVAEESAASAWHVVIDELELTLAGETVVLNPTVEGTVSSTGANIVGEGSVLLNGEKVVTLQGLYENDEIRATFDSANDTLSLPGVTMLANIILEADAENALTADEIALYIPMVFSLMDDTSWISDMIPDLAEAGLNLEVRGERDYAVSFAEEGSGIKFHIAWEPAAEVDASALNGKNIVEIDLFADELPENDVFDVALAGISKLMDDASVQQLMALYESLSIVETEEAA